MRVREVAGGGRAVEVPPHRLRRWFDNFARRNDGVRETGIGAEEVTVWGGNGTVATAAVPFPPLSGASSGTYQGLAVDALVEHAERSRRIGLVLLRKGAHSIGVVEDGSVVASRTARHRVQGRNAAGGWSQQRFARRRQEQAADALRRAADDVEELLVPEVVRLDAIVLGGDRGALDELRADRRLAPVLHLATGRVLDVPEPRRSVLDEAAERAVAVEVVVRDG
ncbi:acVLRF1 family peptidyl-tRNA hydrolase [Haloechinothrix sp. LS1_15]|uniref:acVLRF1 family peptidyl-tRNA hydrolase n=1 Tax=Haloechinothrix sp. LS1_15 TaxID=2652248 RepID=UPI0029466201|nr:acVLRF1 family peptidyl-tRNA hydrolase [Haloechinothrix sp. LS1_15]MDV6013205.1 hypothetical protein [Haloechinothrix sp. LS1_15]